MAARMSDEEYMTNNNVAQAPSAEALLINVDAAKAALKQEKGEYRLAVKNLLSNEKKYQSARDAADEKPSRKRKVRLAEAEERLKLSARAVKAEERRALELLNAAQKENKALCELYQNEGRAKLARKQSARFDKFYLDEENEIRRIGEGAAPIIARYASPDEEARRQRREAPADNRQPQRQDIPPRYDRPYPRSAEYDRYYPERPAHYGDVRVDPFMYRQNVTISPVSVDLSPLIEEAVRETMAKFVSTIEERVDAYIASFSKGVEAIENTDAPADEPIINETPVAESTETAASECVAEATEAATEAVETEADLQPVAQIEEAATEPTVPAVSELEEIVCEERRALDKLTELLEQIKNIVKDAEALSTACAEISAKQKEAMDVEKAIVDSHRTAIREMQGVQVKQKLLSGDQTAIIEEQEAQAARQAQIAEMNKALAQKLSDSAEALDGIVKLGESTEAAIKQTAGSQKALASQSAKTLELQLELTEKQQELFQRQKDAVAAQKKLEKKATAEHK